MKRSITLGKMVLNFKSFFWMLVSEKLWRDGLILKQINRIPDGLWRILDNNRVQNISFDFLVCIEIRSKICEIIISSSLLIIDRACFRFLKKHHFEQFNT
ncbi:hypothetical protein BpHYR1_033647 [Brachionus plicatilis]|uniref:Uncharacterized protein n=1 Tax=Brachionus plicatilis TaxID=10195 RepID=A0A3M7PYE8_BRAPC|nr:hypothetical protein BpHYR1_033647 [Brachionus plicatilis]